MQEINQARGYLEIIPDIFDVGFIKENLLVCFSIVVKLHTMLYTPPMRHDILGRRALPEKIQHGMLDKFCKVVVIGQPCRLCHCWQEITTVYPTRLLNGTPTFKTVIIQLW